MNNLLKAALVPAFTYLAGRAIDASLTTTSGLYAGVDVTSGQSFGGVQGRLDPDGAPVQVTPSVEGNAPGTASRWQANADVLLPFAPSRVPWQPYAGVGLCLVGGDGGTSAGLNLMGGVNVALGPLNGFVQARLTVADGVHLSLTGGALPASGA